MTSEVAAVLRGLAAAFNFQYGGSGPATAGVGSGGRGGGALSEDNMMAKFLAVRAGMGKRPAKRQAVERAPPGRRSLRVRGLDDAPAADGSAASRGDVLVRDAQTPVPEKDGRSSFLTTCPPSHPRHACARRLELTPPPPPLPCPCRRSGLSPRAQQPTRHPGWRGRSRWRRAML